MEEFKLKGSSDSQNINNKLTVLNLLLNHSAERFNHLDSLRDKMLNYSLVIFAVMISFSSRTKSEDWIYLVATPLLLLIIMTVFCYLDNKAHKYVHDWRYTKDKQIEILSMVLNNPNEDIEMASFWKSEPNKAEWNSCRRIIYYGLVFCSIFNCIYVYWFKATNLLNRL